MPIIENYAEHPYEFPQGSVVDDKGTVKAIRDKSLIIPWRVSPTEPSRVRVSEESLKLLQADSVARAWFAPGELVIGKEPEKEADRAKIPTLPSPPIAKKKDAPKAA